MLILLAAGCNIQDVLDDANETFEGLTNPLVVQGWYVGVEPPQDADVDLSGSDFADGAALTVFLADAASVDEMDQAPVQGAEVDADGIPLTEGNGGRYVAVGSDGLEYTNNGESLISIGLTRGVAEALVVTPPPADFVVPVNGTAGTDLTIDLSGQGYDNVLVVVLDSTGSVSWTNTPSDITAIYDFARADTVTRVTIPGDLAFDSAGVYAVGVAGMNKADSDTFVDMNTALSSVMAGKLRFKAMVIQ